MVAATDKGLRPLRYSITDKIFCAGSETGMVEIPEKNYRERKTGPGQLIAVNLKKGKIYKDKEIKDYLSKIINNL